VQPIVNIDGDKIRRCREAQGLTQLYLATVVGVTTDTISRWENRRSPTIKRENALKLAESLGMALEELLVASPTEEAPAAPVSPAGSFPVAPSQHVEEQLPPSSPAAPEPPSSPTVSPPRVVASWRRHALWLGLCVLVSVLSGLGLWFWSARSRLEAKRIMPGHVAPEHPFPVLVRISGRGELRNPVLIREELAGHCDSVGVDESPKRYGKTPRWIGRVENGTASFVYLVRPDPGLASGDSISFSGDVITRGGEGSSQRVGGVDRVVLMPYHWADADRDYRISDDEILAVYETYGGEGRNLPLDDLEQLWLAGTYAWNGRDFAPHPPAQRHGGSTQ